MLIKIFIMTLAIIAGSMIFLKAVEIVGEYIIRKERDDIDG